MRIRAIAHALPTKRVTNEEIIEEFARCNRDAPFASAERRRLEEDLTSHLRQAGAEVRYHRADGEKAMDFAVRAGQAALAEASLHPSEIDLLLFVGVRRGFIEPATANVFQAALELRRATCFDLVDACASWLRGLDVAHQYLHSGTFRNIMILNCEFNFREYVTWRMDSPGALDPLWSGFTIGEAATATIVDEESAQCDYYARFCTTGASSDLCSIPLPYQDQFRDGSSGNGQRPLQFYARARRLNFVATHQLAEQFLGDERIVAYSHDIIFGHAASVPAAKYVARSLDLDTAKYFDTFPRFGNTVSASLPLAMSVARDEGKLRRGDRVLLLIGSAGVTTGYAAFTY